LNSRTGTPPDVVLEKSPARCRAVGQMYCKPRVVSDR
jgi:hypothetical protein